MRAVTDLTLPPIRLAAWLRPYPPVNYEGAQGINGNRILPPWMVISRFYPRYNRITWIREPRKAAMRNALRMPMGKASDHCATDKTDTRPVLTSDIRACHGECTGKLQEYWNEFYSNKRLLGGLSGNGDEGIFKTLPNGKTQVAYGGIWGCSEPEDILHQRHRDKRPETTPKILGSQKKYTNRCSKPERWQDTDY